MLMLAMTRCMVIKSPKTSLMVVLVQMNCMAVIILIPLMAASAKTLSMAKQVMIILTVVKITIPYLAVMAMTPSLVAMVTTGYKAMLAKTHFLVAWATIPMTLMILTPLLKNPMKATMLSLLPMILTWQEPT